MTWTATNDQQLAAIIAGLNKAQRIALRRANGETYAQPGPIPLQWRTGVASQTWRSLDRRDLVSYAGGGWQITDLGRDVADRLAAKARGGYLFPGGTR